MLSWVPPRDDTLPTRVAYAIPRRAGSAVERNRVRRQLRALCAQRASEGRLPAGTLLVVVRDQLSTLTFDQLSADLTTCIDKLGAEAAVSR
jgi:ribonuclease P protein component